MAFKKRKGQITPNYKKYKDGIEIKPSRYYQANCNLMVGSIVGEIIKDSQGNPIPWGHLHFNMGS